MIITFNLIGTGAANNGGTATLFHSANILTAMGHKVFVVSNIENRFTWFPLICDFIETSHPFSYPNADANIATGFQSVKFVASAPISKGKKFHWIRAHETWITKDVEKIYRLNTTKWVNSICLQDFLKKMYGVDTRILYPGISSHCFYNDKPERHGSKPGYIVVGALLNKKPRKRFEWVKKALISLKRMYDSRILFVLFGDCGKDIDNELPAYSYIQQPSQIRLREIYNKIHVWLAPTQSEGLHICPLEAALCGCLVVGTNAPLAGMRDWLTDGETGYVAHNGYSYFYSKILEAIDCPNAKAKHIADNAYDVITSRIGERYENMQRMIELIGEG